MYNVVTIENDELFTSWINRMAEANGFSSGTYFYYNFILGKNYSAHELRIASIHFINDFCKKFDFYNKELSSPIPIIRKHLNYFITLQFQNDLSIWYSIKNRTESDGIKFLHYTNQDKKEIKYCPLCQREAIDKIGVGYRTVEHSIEFNKVCRIHKIPLFSKVKDDIVCQLDVSGKEDVYIAYADAIHSLYNFNYIINQSTFKRIIKIKIKSIKPKDASVDNYLVELYNNSIFALLPYKSKFIKSQLFDAFVNDRGISLEFCIIIILLIFGSMDAFLCEVDITEYTNENETYIDYQNDFSILEENYGLVMIKHSCGNEFITTKEMLNNYCICPKCVTNFDTEFTNFIGAITDGKYVPEKYPDKYSSDFNMYHRLCKEAFSTDMSILFKGITCPNCKLRIFKSDYHKSREFR
jgi:hypothetical protein